MNFFLSWLDPDREIAGEKYKDLQRRLIIMFDSRGCTRSEELADRTLTNFMRRLPALLDSYKEDRNPAPYLHTIARHLYAEYAANQTALLSDDLAQSAPAAPAADEGEERLHDCLEDCLGRLQPQSRELVLDYYRGERQAKINFRKRLALSRGIALNALRIKVHRIRRTLEACLEECLGAGLPSETK